MISLITYQQAKRHVESSMSGDVQRLGEKLEAELSRYSQLPSVLSHDPRLKAILLSQNKQEHAVTSQLLQKWAQETAADTIYLLNEQGKTLASSNWQEEDSFVGFNFAYRPYFTEAINGQLGRYFALGEHSAKRGYYFSAPVVAEGSVRGVLTIKVNLEEISQLWGYDALDFTLIDKHSVIFYSSRPSWLYNTLIPLNKSTKKTVIDSRQYGDAPLSAISTLQTLSQLPLAHSLTLQGVRSNEYQRYFFSQYQMQQTGITIIALSNVKKAHSNIAQAIFLFVVFYSLLVLVITSWNQTLKAKKKLATLNDKLEQLVVERTKNLSKSNQELRNTIEQYEHSQAELRQTQSELLQAAKLAMLGELSAGINHEINQPLSAIRTYAENSRRLLEREKYDVVKSNLDKIVNLNIMVSDIIAKFKVFARKNTQHNVGHTSINDSIHSAFGIIHNKIIQHGVTLRLEDPPQPLVVKADPVQFEQVLINLLHNAIQALTLSPSPQISVTAHQHNNVAVIQVRDNGSGMTEEEQQHIFDPFYTTKNDGLGLGLTISKRIVESFSGQLTVQPAPEGGVIFSITLNIIEEGTK